MKSKPMVSVALSVGAIAALTMWSRDRGATWSEPASFPAATDGNTGLTEASIFYPIGDHWVLSYRQYVAEEKAQYSVLRLSRDGNPASRLVD